MASEASLAQKKKGKKIGSDAPFSEELERENEIWALKGFKKIFLFALFIVVSGFRG